MPDDDRVGLLAFLKKNMAKRVRPGALLIVKEKHGTRYFAVPTVEALAAASLKLVTQRMKEGWILPASETFGPDVRKFVDAGGMPAIEEAKKQVGAVALLPDYQREQTIRRLDELAESVKAYPRHQRHYELAKAAVKEKNGYFAFQVLMDRERYEYEGFEIDFAEEV
jgi:hypothetical protein